MPPKKPTPTGRNPNSASRQTKEAIDNATQKQYRTALNTYYKLNKELVSERLQLMGELLQLKVELDEVEEMEKWLLLSMVIRNQSSLLGFMGASEQ